MNKTKPKLHKSMDSTFNRNEHLKRMVLRRAKILLAKEKEIEDAKNNRSPEETRQ